jgi:hypothetical protein
MTSSRVRAADLPATGSCGPPGRRAVLALPGVAQLMVVLNMTSVTIAPSEGGFDV